MCFFHVNQLKAKWPENVSKVTIYQVVGKVNASLKDSSIFS